MKRRLKVLKMINFFNSLVFFAPLALLVRTSRGISLQQFFMLQIILSFGIFVFEIPGGMLSDRIGYRNTLVISHCVTFLCRVLLWQAGSFGMFAAEAIVEAFAGSLTSGTSEAYLYADDPDSFTKNIALLGNWSIVGFVLSTVLYFPLIRLGTLQTLLIGTVITSFLSAIFSFFLPRERSKQIELAGTKRKKLDFKSLPIKAVILFPVMDSGLSISGLVINFFYITKLQECHIGDEWMSGVIIGYSLIQMLVPLAVRAMRNIPSRAVKVIGTAILIDVLFLVMCVINNLYVLIPMLILPALLSIIGYIVSTLQNNFVDEIQGDEHRATILSIFSMGTNLFDIVFLAITGFLSSLGSLIPFLIAGNAIVLVSILFVFCSRNWKFCGISDHE